MVTFLIIYSSLVSLPDRTRDKSVSLTFGTSSFPSLLWPFHLKREGWHSCYSALVRNSHLSRIESRISRFIYCPLAVLQWEWAPGGSLCLCEPGVNLYHHPAPLYVCGNRDTEGSSGVCVKSQNWSQSGEWAPLGRPEPQAVFFTPCTPAWAGSGEPLGLVCCASPTLWWYTRASWLSSRIRLEAGLCSEDT